MPLNPDQLLERFDEITFEELKEIASYMKWKIEKEGVLVTVTTDEDKFLSTHPVTPEEDALFKAAKATAEAYECYRPSCDRHIDQVIVTKFLKCPTYINFKKRLEKNLQGN